MKKNKFAIMIMAIAIVIMFLRPVSTKAADTDITSKDIIKSVNGKMVTVKLNGEKLKYELSKDDILKVTIKSRINDEQTGTLTVKAYVYFDCKKAVARTTATITYLTDNKKTKTTSVKLTKAKVVDVTKIYKKAVSLDRPRQEDETVEITTRFSSIFGEDCTIKKSKQGDYLLHSARVETTRLTPFYIDIDAYSTLKKGSGCSALVNYSDYYKDYICIDDSDGFYYVNKYEYEEYKSLSIIQKYNQPGADMGEIFWISDKHIENGKIRIYRWALNDNWSSKSYRPDYNWEGGTKEGLLVISKDAVISYLITSKYPYSYGGMTFEEYMEGVRPSDWSFFDWHLPLYLTADESGRVIKLTEYFEAG